jgi:uncharacterized GH25 family protein
MKFLIRIISALSVILVSTGFAHDTWLQTNTNVVRLNDAISIDFMLGNHGNSHRDFKIAGKPSLDSSTIDVIQPDGTVFDLKPSFTDRGYAPKEGFWSAVFQPTQPGIYLISQKAEQVVTYAPERVVRSAKVLFLAATLLDKVPITSLGYDHVLGHSLELVPCNNPLVPMGPGVLIKMKLLYYGKPLAQTKVSFIPRGAVLSTDFDKTYERNTDQDGIVSFEPKEANLYLIVSHFIDNNGSGSNYKYTNYCATLTLIVPGVCPCCSE